MTGVLIHAQAVAQLLDGIRLSSRQPGRRGGHPRRSRWRPESSSRFCTSAFCCRRFAALGVLAAYWVVGFVVVRAGAVRCYRC